MFWKKKDPTEPVFCQKKPFSQDTLMVSRNGEVYFFLREGQPVKNQELLYMPFFFDAEQNREIPLLNDPVNIKKAKKAVLKEWKSRVKNKQQHIDVKFKLKVPPENTFEPLPPPSKGKTKQQDNLKLLKEYLKEWEKKQEKKRNPPNRGR